MGQVEEIEMRTHWPTAANAVSTVCLCRRVRVPLNPFVGVAALPGCSLSSDGHHLAASLPKQLYTSLPAIHLLPQANRVPPTHALYQCPVYKTLARQVSPRVVAVV